MERGGGSTKTGWFYHRARYYWPLVRRYVQEDPIGYGGGTNLYAYVDGRPLEAIDPNGTAAQSPDDARVAGGGGLSLRIGAGSGSVSIDGVAVSGGAAFLGGAGFTAASNSGFYSIHSNVARGSVFQTDRSLQRNSTPGSSPQTRQFDAYAPPLIWGREKDVATHSNGPAGFEIKFTTPTDNTIVTGEVRYWWSGGWVRRQFGSVITFVTGNAAAKVYVRFKGNPLGSAVHGTIRP